MNLRHAFGMLALVGCFAANAAETYRTNTVEGLIYLLANHNSTGDVIELEAGDYQMPDEPTYTAPAGSSSYGKSSIHVHRQTIRGMGRTPSEVRLVGSGKHRVVFLEAYGTLENLTITGGYTDDSEKATYGNSHRTAGCYGNGILTNCVITGNDAYHLGGGVHGGVKLYDCIVENNRSRNSGGGGGHNITAYRTIFRNNWAKTDGGGVYNAKLYDCILTNNTAATGAGGGGYNVTEGRDTLFADNKAVNGGGVGNGATMNMSSYSLYGCVISNNQVTSTSGYGGGLYCQWAWNSTITANRSPFAGGAYKSQLTDCVVSDNVATNNVRVSVNSINCNQSGGGAYNCSLLGCTIVGNHAYGNGGGVCCDSDTITVNTVDKVPVTEPLIISNCVIAANICSNRANHAYGGGMFVEGGTVTHCEIRGNATIKDESSSTSSKSICGGIASVSRSGVISNSTIHDNFSTSAGGGAYRMKLVNCVVSNNITESTVGLNAYECDFRGGEVVGTPVAYGSAYGTMFHGFGPEVELIGNPFRSETRSTSAIYQYYPQCTNCLFVGNRLSSGSIFSGQSTPVSSASLVNCTIVSNLCDYMFTTFPDEAYPMKVENCIFYGNRKIGSSATKDLFTYNCKTGSLRFAHCAYGVSALANGPTPDYFDAGNYHLGENGLSASPGFAFAKNPAHPYALRTSSGLLGLAKVADWMADAYDIRGEADDGKYRRLRDGKADLGCYQCWDDFIGTRIFVR